MDTILIAGVESVVGANVAAALCRQYRVVGLASATPVPIAGCESALCRSDDAESVSHWATLVQPSWMLYCGSPAYSTWQRPAAPISKFHTVTAARNWAAAANRIGSRFTMISSDAIFTGPWMFHDENSSCLCPSEEAITIRTIEANVFQLCPQALVVRTNAYGWSAEPGGRGWIERTLSALEARNAGSFEWRCHATPILATDLAEFLEQANRAGLHGVYHIAGAERVNPARFAQRLAAEFGLPSPALDVGMLSDRPTGFGCGETSLQTRKIRKALGVAMPTLAEGLNRLREQQQNGYREQLHSASPAVHDKVA